MSYNLNKVEVRDLWHSKQGERM